MVDEYTEVVKMQQGTQSLNEEQLNQVKDVVWNTYVQTKILEKEANALGLTVTNAELQNILKEGSNPMLMQTPFVRSEEHTSELQSRQYLVCRLLLEKKNKETYNEP